MHIYNIYKDASYLQLTRHASTIPWNSNEIINPPTPELYRKVVKAFKDALKSSDDYQFCGLYGYKDFYVLLGHCWKMDVARQVTNYTPTNTVEHYFIKRHFASESRRAPITGKDARPIPSWRHTHLDRVFSSIPDFLLHRLYFYVRNNPKLKWLYADLLEFCPYIHDNLHAASDINQSNLASHLVYTRRLPESNVQLIFSFASAKITPNRHMEVRFPRVKSTQTST